MVCLKKVDSFILFIILYVFQKSDGDIKILAPYHQYFVVKKAFEYTRIASSASGNGCGSVFWYTQGSGKSFIISLL